MNLVMSVRRSLTRALEDASSSKGEVGGPIFFVGMWERESQNKDDDDQICHLQGYNLTGQ